MEESAINLLNDTSISSVSFRGFGEVIDQSRNIIKVIGVGGGGSNAVKKMVNEGLSNVSFAVVNTDSQALKTATVPTKLQIGNTGLGVGGVPERGREAAEFSIEDIKHLFDDNTKMVFITAGMGGGTGTGASPVIARVAREKGILTVGVVTLPFKFEKDERINKALKGVAALKEEVDSLIVINNERLIELYENQAVSINEALQLSDKVVSTATRSIAEIITVEGQINRDFCDVQTVLQNGGATIMASGRSTGEHRVVNALCQALQSPMLNKSDIQKSKKLLYIIYQSHNKEVLMPELTEIQTFMDNMSSDLEVLWGLYYDDSLGDDVRVDIVATGFDRTITKEDDNVERMLEIEKLRKFYYTESNPNEILTDIVDRLVNGKINSAEDTKDEDDTVNVEDTTVDFAGDAIPAEETDSLETVNTINTDVTSTVIISFDDDTEASAYVDEAKENTTESAAQEMTFCTEKPVQTSIDFGNDEDNAVSDNREDNSEVEKEDDKTEFTSKFSYYFNQFKSGLEKFVTEN